METSLCWDCRNCTKPEVCSWANDFTPVKGWTAIPTTVGGYHPFDSYLVKECPLFSRAAFSGGQTRDLFVKADYLEIDDQDAENLAEAIIERAIEDWKFLEYGNLDNITFSGSRIKRSELLEFFFSPWFEQLLASFTDIPPNKIREHIKITDKMKPKEVRKI